MGYIIAKAIENPLSCNESPENDPRLKRSDEKEIHFDSEDTTGKDPYDNVTRKTFSTPNNENDNDHDTTDNDIEISNEFASNSNALPQKLPLVNSVTKSPVNVTERGIDRLTSIKDALLEQPVYYKAIDPKYIIISGLSLPIPTKNITNVSKSDDPVNIDLKESITTPLDYSNLTKSMNVSIGDETNDTERKQVVKNDADTDVSNIRELREHLLDHLLDYFLNIIKEEDYIRNDTRKKNGKDRMKVEDKLRNYYDPHHLDMLFDDDDDYYDNNLDPSDYHGDNESEEDLLDNVNQNKAVNKENITNIYLLTLADKVDKNAAEHTSPEDLQNEAMSLEKNLNKSSPDGKSFNVNILEPVTSKYVNLTEKENDLTNVLLNTTEKSEDAFDTNVNVTKTTTEISILNEALKDKAAEVHSDLLNYSDEEVTDGVVYDNGALTVGEYTSYEDYIDSDEFEVVKNVTVHENDRNPIVVTTANGRRKNALEREIYIANGTLNDTSNITNYSQIGNDSNISKDEGKKDTLIGKKDKPNNSAIQDLSNKNDDNTPCDEDNLAENNNKNSLKRSKQGIKRKLRIDKNCGNLVNKNNKLILKKSNKYNCRKSIILNLNINLI